MTSTTMHHASAHEGHDKHAGHDPEVFRRRFWLTFAVSIPIVATSPMIMDWFGYELGGVAWVGPVLGTFVYLWGGWPFLKGGVDEVRDRAPGMMLLIAMAITVAWGSSMASSLGWFDLEFWWELAALVTIMLLGHWQEMKAIGQAQGALAALAALLPDDAELVDDGQIRTVALGDLAGRATRAGPLRRARPGRRDHRGGRGRARRVDDHRRVPTGRRSDAGDKVVAGTVSTDSSIRVRVSAVGDDTALAGIQRLVAEAQASNSRAQVLADRFAKWLFYVATGAAAITFVAWLLAGDADQAVTEHGDGARDRVPPRARARDPARGRALDRGGRAQRDPGEGPARARTHADRDAVLFDKTGTLTEGRHVVTGVAGATVPSDDVLRWAGAVELDSEHPLARAIVTAARAQGDVPAASEFRAMTGRGVGALVDGRRYAVGGPALLRERSLAVPGADPRRDRHVVRARRGRALPRPRRRDHRRRRARGRASAPKRARPSPTCTRWASRRSR